MFPVIEQEELPNPLVDTIATSPIPWTYRFDWETKQFKKGLDGRYLRTSTYAEYLAEVVKKTLHTKRFQYSIYSDRIGVDFLSDLGKMRSQISLPVIKAQTEEALEAHSEIERAEVTDICFERNKVVFALEIEGIRRKTRIEVDIWER